MSIRYTLRHNIPTAKLSAEDANDSSTWDLNLLRKHELAETDDHRIVYRQHNGQVVDWSQAATQAAREAIVQLGALADFIVQSGGLNVATQEITDSSTAVATTEFVHNLLEATLVDANVNGVEF